MDHHPISATSLFQSISIWIPPERSPRFLAILSLRRLCWSLSDVRLGIVRVENQEHQPAYFRWVVRCSLVTFSFKVPIGTLESSFFNDYLLLMEGIPRPTTWLSMNFYLKVMEIFSISTGEGFLQPNSIIGFVCTSSVVLDFKKVLPPIKPHLSRMISRVTVFFRPGLRLALCFLWPGRCFVQLPNLGGVPSPKG